MDGMRVPTGDEGCEVDEDDVDEDDVDDVDVVVGVGTTVLLVVEVVGTAVEEDVGNGLPSHHPKSGWQPTSGRQKSSPSPQ
jgi:hypothetical protein